MSESQVNLSAAPRSIRPRVESGDGNHELVLIKDGQRRVFQCAPGEEKQLLQTLRELARDPGSDLRWYDAAVITHALSQRMQQRLQHTLAIQPTREAS